MKKLFLLLFGMTLFVSMVSYAQPGIEWQKSIGGTGMDFGKGLCVGNDSAAYYITGYTNSTNGNIDTSFGGMDIFMSKLDLSGNILWTRSYGGLANDYSQSIISTRDNGILICGFTNDSVSPGTHGGFDVMFIKTDSSGNQQWMRYYGGSQNDGDHFADIIETPEGGFVCMTGSESYDGDLDTNYGSTDFWLFKTDSLGTLQWEKNYGGTGDEDGHCILPMPDGGFIIDGHTASNNIDVSGLHNPNSGIHDGWVVRIDSSHNIRWQKCIGGAEFELINKMCLDSAGNIIIVGYTASNDGDIAGNHGMNDVWIVKMDTAAGNLLSSKVYGGPGDDYGLFLLKNADAGITFSGYSDATGGDVTGNHGNFDYWLLKTDQQGNIIWENSYGGTGSDRNNGINAACGDGVLIFGQSNSTNGDVTGNQGQFDCWVAKLMCQKPSASFTCTPNPSCTGDSVYFTNTTTGADTYHWFINGEFYSNDISTSTLFTVHGRDTITLFSNFESCYDTAQQIITVNPGPLVELGPDTTICQGCPILLDAGNSGATYLWSSGDTTQQVTVSNTDTVWVMVTMYGCTGSDTIAVIVDTLTGIGNADKNSFLIFPNPTSGIIRINPGFGGEYFLDVLLPDNRTVSSTGPYFGDTVIELDLHASGCYIAVLKNREGILAVKKLLLYRPER